MIYGINKEKLEGQACHGWKMIFDSLINSLEPLEEEWETNMKKRMEEFRYKNNLAIATEALEKLSQFPEIISNRPSDIVAYTQKTARTALEALKGDTFCNIDDCSLHGSPTSPAKEEH